MQTFVVLLRGINVGSTRKVPMADLRATCLKLGWQRPETYIQMVVRMPYTTMFSYPGIPARTNLSATSIVRVQ